MYNFMIILKILNKRYEVHKNNSYSNRSFWIFFIFLRKNNKKNTINYEQFINKQIQFKDLDFVLNQLLFSQPELEYQSFSITSNEIDRISFFRKDQYVFIEYDVIKDEQIPFIEKLKQFSIDYNYTIKPIVIGKVPLSKARIYKIEFGGNKEKAIEVGIDIMKSVFNRNEKTKFDIQLN
mgnify:CR=1 FL=1